MESDHQDRPSTPEYTITPITEHQGLYYESHGQVGLLHLTWDLVVYVNLNEQLAEYDCTKVSLSQNSAVLYRSFRKRRILEHVDLYQIEAVRAEVSRSK